MKIFLRKITSIVLSISLILSLSSSAFAAENTNSIYKHDVKISTATKNSIQQLNASGLDGDLTEKILIVSNHLSFNDDQKTLKIDLSDEVLVDEYGFTKQQLVDLKKVLNRTYKAPAVKATVANIYQNLHSNLYAKVSSNSEKNVEPTFYFSNADLQTGIFAILATAAEYGPAALMAAWTTISTYIAGPLGIITSLLGIGFFADLALTITGALAEGKGVAFYVEWGWPPVRVEKE